MKKIALPILQVLVTVGILYFILRDPATRAEMWGAFRRADLRWLALGFGFYCLTQLAGVVRWQVLLRAQGIVISWVRAAQLFMIGVFFSLFLFGVTGGDVVKIYCIVKEAPGKKATAFFSVLIDRIVGLLALLTLAVAVVAWRYEWLARTPETRGLVWVFLFILVGGAGCIAFSFLVTGFNLAGRLPAHFPMRDRFIELSAAYHLYAKAWRSLVLAFVCGLVVQVSFICMFWAATRSLHLGVPFADMFSLTPIVSTIQAMPISLGGTGLREGPMAILMSRLCGTPEAIGALVGSIGTLIVYLFGALGGPLYMIYRPTRQERRELAQSRGGAAS